MPRHPRPDLAGVPQHVVQRGNNREPCFFEEADYRRYLANLREAAERHSCAVHAYVLMTNHVHLLVTPAQAGAVGKMMQTLGRNYVGGINARYRRSGTLWEDRYKACLVDSDEYLLTCYRYIDLNPVRAAMVAEPETYSWSSYSANALGRSDAVLQPHQQYLALGACAATRCATYRALFDDAIDAERMAQIRAYVQQQRALGSSRFQAKIEATLGRCMAVRPRTGRAGSHPAPKACWPAPCRVRAMAKSRGQASGLPASIGWRKILMLRRRP